MYRGAYGIKTVDDISFCVRVENCGRISNVVKSVGILQCVCVCVIAIAAMA